MTNPAIEAAQASANPQTPQKKVVDHIDAMNESSGKSMKVPEHVAELNAEHGATSQEGNLADEVGSEADEKIVSESKPKKKVVKKQEETKVAQPDVVKLKYSNSKGQPIESDYDLGNREQVIKDLQLSKAATVRFEEGSALKKQAIEIANLMHKSPEVALKQLGWDDAKLDAWMTDQLFQRIQHNNMTPKEKELIKREQALREAELRRQTAEEANKAGQRQEKWNISEKQIIDGLENAWLNYKSLPKTRDTKMAAYQYIQDAVNMGIPVDFNDVLAQVKDNTAKTFKDMATGLDEDGLIALFGEDVAKKINKAIVKKVKKDPTKIVTNKEKLPERVKTMDEFASKKDFFNYLANLPKK